MIAELETAMGIKRSGVLEQAIRQLHKREIPVKSARKPKKKA